MAKIILTVDINKATATKQIQEIEQQLNRVAQNASKVALPNATTSQVESLRKGFANLATQLKTLTKQYPTEAFTKITSDVQKAFNAIQVYSAKWQELSQTNKNFTEEEKSQLKALGEQYKKLSADISVVKATYDKLATSDPFQGKIGESLNKTQSKLATLLSSTKNIQKYYASGTFDGYVTQIEKLIAKVGSFQEIVKNSGELPQSFHEEYNQVIKQTEDLGAAIKTTAAESKSLHGTILDIVSGFAKFQFAAMAVMMPLNAIRNAVQSLNEVLIKTEDSVIALKRVLNEELGDKEVADKLYELAQNYGQTFENVQQLALNFARTGMSWAETINATEAALLALNVAELDVTQASDGMIAILTQFNVKASELVEIVDKLNISADNAAVTTEKLLTALQRVGSSAVNSNMSLEETVALITALSESTGRSGENIGTALNSLIQFSKKDSALDVFASLGSDTAEVVARYRAGAASILDIWKQLAMHIKELEGNTQLINSEDFDTLNEELKESLGEDFATLQGIYGTASTYRQNYFIALLNNLDEVDSRVQMMNNSLGYSQQENEQYLDTYTAKVNTLKAKWEELANDENGILFIKKVFVDSGITLLELLDKLGGIKTILIEIAVIGGTILALTKGEVILTSISKIYNGLVNLTIKALPNAITAWKSYAANVVSANTAMQATMPLIGLVVVAISALITGIKKYREEQEQARKETIATWEEVKTQGEELLSLAKQYQTLTKEDENFYAVEQQIVELLGNEKQEALKTLTQQTDEYTEAVKNLTEQEKLRYEMQKAAALQAVKDQIKGIDVGGRLDGNYGLTNVDYFNKEEIQLLNKLGVEYNVAGTSSAGTKIHITNLSTDNSFEAQLANYEKLVDWQQQIEKIYNEAVLAGDEEKSNSALHLWNNLEREIAYVREYFDTYYQLINNNKEESEDVGEETDKWRNSLEDVANKYDKIIDKIKEIREEEDTRLDLEEKRKAVLEAEQALLDAKNERNVRVFNSQTGNWEWQANEKAIQEAEENLKDAKKDLENAGWDSVENLLEQDVVTNEEMLNVINSIADILPEWGDSVIALIKEVSKVDLNVNSGGTQNAIGFDKWNNNHLVYFNKAYDNGGVLQGLGGIKATQQDEIVLPPELTRKILTPTSNEEFVKFSKALGLLFGTSRTVMPYNGNIVRNQNSVANNDNRSYVINGVPITHEQAQNYTVAQICEVIDLVE